MVLHISYQRYGLHKAILSATSIFRMHNATQQQTLTLIAKLSQNENSSILEESLIKLLIGDYGF
jgi:hypothetical protein